MHTQYFAKRDKYIFTIHFKHVIQTLFIGRLLIKYSKMIKEFLNNFLSLPIKFHENFLIFQATKKSLRISEKLDTLVANLDNRKYSQIFL